MDAQRGGRFVDRTEAGRGLAACLEEYRATTAVVAALPRGGVPVAFEIATALGLPLDVIVVRKLGAPWQPELAVGAVGEHGVRVLNTALALATGIGDEELARIERREAAEVERRAALFRSGRAGVRLVGHTVIVVDDGVATRRDDARRLSGRPRPPAPRGSSSPSPSPRQNRCPSSPARSTSSSCLMAPAGFNAVGEWYENFAQTTDAEVIDLLGRAAASQRGSGGPDAT